MSAGGASLTRSSGQANSGEPARVVVWCSSRLKTGRPQDVSSLDVRPRTPMDVAEAQRRDPFGRCRSRGRILHLSVALVLNSSLFSTSADFGGLTIYLNFDA